MIYTHICILLHNIGSDRSRISQLCPTSQRAFTTGHIVCPECGADSYIITVNNKFYIPFSPELLSEDHGVVSTMSNNYYNHEVISHVANEGVVVGVSVACRVILSRRLSEKKIDPYNICMDCLVFTVILKSN